MVCLILYISLILCNRLLRLKMKDDLYVTNSNGALRLEPHTPSNMSNQHVVIHRRTLYFLRSGTYYTLAMVQGGVEIKPIVYNAMSERDIGFLTNTMLGPHRRKINPFAHLTQDKKRHQDSKERGDAGALSAPHRLPRVVNTTESKPLDEKLPRVSRVRSRPRRSEEMGGEGAGAVQSRQRPMEPVHDASDENQEEGSKSHMDADVAKDTKQGSRMTAGHRPGRDSHLIESDSKMEDHEFGYVIKNVTVSEIDHDYFKLMAKGNACVTYYKDNFVFMPCSSAVEQVFKLENTEDIAKRGAGGKPRGSNILEDDVLSYKYQGYQSDDETGYNRGSRVGTEYVHGEQGHGVVSEVKSSSRMEYKLGSDIDSSMKEILDSADEHGGKHRSGGAKRSGEGQGKEAAREQRSERGSYGSKNTDRSQRLNFNEDFISRFKEVMKSDELNDIV